MDKEKWLSLVQHNRDKLLSLIESYHPASNPRRVGLPITAPNAELACENVRQSIANRERNRPSPTVRFSTAIDKGDVGEVMSLLNGAWFGVPESTSCWRLEGFKEAVDLLEDPPEEAHV